MRRLGIAYAVALIPALALALGQPVWSRVDEPAHYDVIAQYAAGVYPHDSMTTIRPETLEVMERTGVFGFVVDSAYARPDPSAPFETIPTGLSSSAYVLWVRRHVFQFSYEAFQPPLYYASALPAWLAGNAAGGAMGAVYAVRIFNALLAALLAPLTMLITMRLWPGSGSASWAAALLAATFPGMLNLTTVTNDVLVTVLGAACILVAITRTWTTRRAILLGLLFGAAVLTKTTAVALAPALAIALLQRRRGGGLKALATTAALSGLCVMPWLASNLAIYGELFTTKEQLAMSAFPPRTAALDFWSVSSLHSFVTFWTGDPFLSHPGAVPLALVAALVTALSLVGLARAWRGRQLSGSSDVFVVLVVAAAGAALITLSSPLLAAFNAPGRFAYVALAAVLALVVVGLWVELPSPRLRWGTVGTFVALSVAGLAASIYPPAPPPRDPGHPVVASVRALDTRGTFAQLTISARACAIDTSGDSWVQLQLENAGSGAVEWSQSVQVRAGGKAVTTSNYSRSAQLPMAIAPGPSYVGWLWLGPSTRLQHLDEASLYFKDLAADGYRTVGDLEIPTPLC